MSLYNESNGHKEKNSGSFLEKLGKLFWNIPGERHKILHPALILYLLILVWYSYLLLGPYNSRISPSDFLNYIKLAGTDDPSTFGRIFCERLSVLLPLRLLIVVFKFSPAVAGKIVILAVELLLLLSVMFVCHRFGGAIAGVLAGCLLCCSTFIFLTTDIRSDHFAGLFLVIALLLSSESHGRSPPIKRGFIFFAGVVLVLLSASKPNFVFFIPLFALPFFVSRQWKQLLVLFSGVISGIVFLGVLFISLYPKEIWSNYFQFLSISFSTYGNPNKSIYPMEWIRLFTNPKFYILSLYIIPLFRKSYRVRGVRELFLSSLFYVSSMMILSMLNPQLQVSDVYMLVGVLTLVMGSALVIAKITEIHFAGIKKEFFLGLAITAMFILACYIGTNQSASLVNQSARIPALIYLFTPLLSIGFLAWLFAFNRGKLVLILTIISLAIPQTLLISAYSFQRFKKEVSIFNNQFYSFTDRIPTSYLEKEPTLISLKAAPLEDTLYERYTPKYRYAWILLSRRYPPPKVDIFINQGREVETALKTEFYKSVITDDPGMIMQICGVRLVQQIVEPEQESNSMPLYYLELAESSGELTHDYESRFLNWKGPDTVSMEDLAGTASPLMILGGRGNFLFERVPFDVQNVIRIKQYGLETRQEIQFGYWQGRNAFNISFQPGQEIVLSLFARLSDENTSKVEVFIQDEVEDWERSRYFVHGPTWKRYVVSKKIREGTKNLILGIFWQPNEIEEWLEIKEVKIFVQTID